jgi:hypothetical protein
MALRKIISNMTTRRWIATLKRTFRLGAPAQPLTETEAQSEIESILRLLLKPIERRWETLATVWDGNAYIQCRRLGDGTWRCEAAGSLMQSSLRHVLTPERIDRLHQFGWRLDPSFGNYVQDFAADLPPEEIAAVLLTSLVQAYCVVVGRLEFQSWRVGKARYLPRNGPSQNLAGLINDARSMASTAIRAGCYVPAPEVPEPSLEAGEPVGRASDLLDRFGTRIASEIARLQKKLNSRRAFLIMQTDTGYIQCRPEWEERAICCEAISADSWPALAGILTESRIAHLDAAGFERPGLRQNYWRHYKVADYDSATVANALLTVLHKAYGCDITSKITLCTEWTERDLT